MTIEQCYEKIYAKLLEPGLCSDYKEGLSYALSVLVFYRDCTDEFPRMGKVIRMLESEAKRQTDQLYKNQTENRMGSANYNAGVVNALHYAIHVLQEEMLNG